MTNIDIYKSCISLFVSVLTISNILTFQMFDPKKVGQSHEQFLEWCPSMAIIKIYFKKIIIFYFSEDTICALE